MSRMSIIVENNHIPVAINYKLLFLISNCVSFLGNNFQSDCVYSSVIMNIETKCSKFTDLPIGNFFKFSVIFLPFIHILTTCNWNN